ncbi:hypothetical protein Cgig2_014134 [Carnegiea gigantea]|uniref:Uncharacterized protein n=1 Tax=Carnegiea gigantea TaxID=171969 RepID=A0A9Q1JY98_9CARY|nr:hypothetical protein Cgig2_014134 [Carnegiea gigantea]
MHPEIFGNRAREMNDPSAAVHNCTNYEAHRCHHKTVLIATIKGNPECRAAAYYELPELPQAIFYAMLLNEAEELGVLHGPRLWLLEVALTELRWGAFESWIWSFDDRVYEARFYPKSSSGEGVRTGRQGETSNGGAVDGAAYEGTASSRTSPK